VTIDGCRTTAGRAPFFVIATQKPRSSTTGTFPLPEAQLDRFALRLALGYPEPGRRGADAGRPDGSPRARRSRCSRPSADCSRAGGRRARPAARCTSRPSLHAYVVALCGATRADPPAGPRCQPRRAGGDAGAGWARGARRSCTGRDPRAPRTTSRRWLRTRSTHRLLPAGGCAGGRLVGFLAELLAAGCPSRCEHGGWPGRSPRRGWAALGCGLRCGRLRPAVRHHRGGAARCDARRGGAPGAAVGRSRRWAARRPWRTLPAFRAERGESVRVEIELRPLEGRAQRARCGLLCEAGGGPTCAVRPVTVGGASRSAWRL